jgi:phage gp36-like protein
VSVSYTDPKALRDATGTLELSQVATPDTATALVPVSDMEAVIASGGIGTADAVTAYNKLLDAISRASGRIDAALAVQYTLPLTYTPQVLKEYAIDIARYYLHRNGASPPITDRYNNAISDLNMIASGKLNIGAIGTNNTGTLTAGFGIAYVAPNRDNTYTTLSTFANGFCQ